MHPIVMSSGSLSALQLEGKCDPLHGGGKHSHELASSLKLLQLNAPAHSPHLRYSSRSVMSEALMQ